MKKIIALLTLLLTGSLYAETIQLETPITVGGQITAIEVGGIQYDSNNNSWSINASPVVSYQEPQSSESVYASILIAVNLNITVERAEIEAVLGIENIENATVKQLNDTVRALALQKAINILSPTE